MLVHEMAGFGSLSQPSIILSLLVGAGDRARVIDEKGNPVKGVRFTFMGGSRMMPINFDVRTDGQGNATAPMLSGGGSLYLSDQRYKVLGTAQSQTKDVPPKKINTYTVRLKSGIVEKSWGWIIPPEPGTSSAAVVSTYQICTMPDNNPVETVKLPSGGYGVETKPEYRICDPRAKPPVKPIAASLLPGAVKAATDGSSAAQEGGGGSTSGQGPGWTTYALVGGGVVAVGVVLYFALR